MQQLLNRYERQNVSNDDIGFPLEVTTPQSDDVVSVSCQRTYSLSYEQALDYARSFIIRLPLGSTFTCYKVFEGIETRFDRRRLGAVMRSLQANNIIQCIEYVKEKREHGNAGIVALFERIK